MLIFILNLSFTRCIYERIDEKQGSIWRLQPVSVWLGQCCYINILWQCLSLLRNIWNVNFFWLQNYDWYSLQLHNSLPYPTLTSQCYKNIFFKNRDFSSYHFTNCQHLKGCLFSPTQFLMTFGRGKYYGGRLEANRWIRTIKYFTKHKKCYCW